MSYAVLNERGIKRLFKNPNGPVAAIINEKAERIFRAAETNINEFESRSGDLAASLRKIPKEGTVYHVVVGADAQHRGFPYARALETGINPWTGGPLLGGNTKAPGGPTTPVTDKAFMVPAVKSSGFRLRRA